MSRGESVAVVIVTYNRADLLARMLDGLAAQTRPADAVYVIDNASTDDTRDAIARDDLPLHVTHCADNLGGAGGFHLGVRQAYDAGHERIWLVDDDVVPAPDCLAVLLATDEDCVAAIREDTSGRLVEKAAVDFDLRNPFAIRPKRASVDDVWLDRAGMPERVELQNVSFEGFLFRRTVVDTIGLPDASYFIFYDDVDFAVRARRAGVADLGDPRRGAGEAARLRPAARPGHLEGLLHVPEPLRGPLPVRREPPGAGQALGRRRGGRCPQPAARRPGRGPECDPGHPGRARNAVGPARDRRLTNCVNPRGGNPLDQA